MTSLRPILSRSSENAVSVPSREVDAQLIRELHVRMTLLHRAVAVDDAERVLPGIEPRDLREQRPVDVDAELIDDVGRILRRERHVLRLQRIDRRSASPIRIPATRR